MSPETVPVILGAAGMLGLDLSEVLGAAHPGTVCATRDEMDITDYWATRWDLERLGATVVINCAAYTDVDGCESDPRKAERLNGEAAGNLARACDEAGARLIHISTDFVFDGEASRPYGESDATNPISAYGRSKLQGELAVLGSSPSAMVLRCSWLYGPHGGNFISAILGAARRGGPLSIVNDQLGTPTYTTDLSRAIVRLLDVKHEGILHFANRGICSRVEFAREALRLAGLEGVEVREISSDQLDRPARRPAYSALDTSLFMRLTGETPRTWEPTLQDYVARLE